MRMILKTVLIALLCSTSAHALTVTSKTRVFTAIFAEDQVSIQLCNIKGEGCLVDEISSAVIGERIQKGVSQLNKIVNDEAYREEVKTKMLKEIELTGESAYTIPGLGDLTAKGSYYLDQLFNKVLPRYLRQLESVDTDQMYSQNLKKYKAIQDKEVSLPKEKEFGVFLDDILSELLIELR